MQGYSYEVKCQVRDKGLASRASVLGQLRFKSAGFRLQGLGPKFGVSGFFGLGFRV